MDNNSHIRNVKVLITQPVTPEDFGKNVSLSRTGRTATIR